MRPLRAACGCLSRRGFLGSGAAALLPGSAAAQDRPGRIDVHHHLYPPAWMQVAARHATMQSVQKDWTIEHSIEQMDRAGIQTSLLSIATPGVWFGDPAEARQLARLCNEWSAGLVGLHAGRFGNFAMLPLPDIEGSLREIEYALDTLHMDGVGMFTNYPNNVWLGDPVFAPVYAELNRRRAVVYTHPTNAECCTNLVSGVADPVIEFGTSTTRAFVAMVFNGFATRYPDISVIFSHAGGTMPFLMERLEFQAQSVQYRRELPDGVHPAIRHFHYETAQAANRQALGTLLEIVPVSQILFGTDYPYRQCDEQAANLTAMKLPAADTRAIERDNAVRMMPRLG